MRYLRTASLRQSVVGAAVAAAAGADVGHQGEGSVAGIPRPRSPCRLPPRLKRLAKFATRTAQPRTPLNTISHTRHSFISLGTKLRAISTKTK